MKFYVASNAIEELNRDKETLIRDEDGKAVGGSLEIEKGKPIIYDLFGSGEFIHLDRLRLFEADDFCCLDCDITTQGVQQTIQFHMLGGGKTLQTEWKA